MKHAGEELPTPQGNHVRVPLFDSKVAFDSQEQKQETLRDIISALLMAEQDKI